MTLSHRSWARSRKMEGIPEARQVASTTFTGCQNRMTTIRNAADDSRGSQSDMACVEGCICIYINIINCAPSSKKAMHYTNRRTQPGNNVNHAIQRRRDSDRK